MLPLTSASIWKARWLGIGWLFGMLCLGAGPGRADTPATAPVQIINEAPNAWYLMVNNPSRPLDLKVDKGDGQGFQPLRRGWLKLPGRTVFHFTCSQERVGRVRLPLTTHGNRNPYSARAVFLCTHGILILDVVWLKPLPADYVAPIDSDQRTLTIHRKDWDQPAPAQAGPAPAQPDLSGLEALAAASAAAQPAAVLPAAPGSAAGPGAVASRLKGRRVFRLRNDSALPWSVQSLPGTPGDRDLGVWRQSRNREGLFVRLLPGREGATTFTLPPGRTCVLPVGPGESRVLRFMDAGRLVLNAQLLLPAAGAIQFKGDPRGLEVLAIAAETVMIAAAEAPVDHSPPPKPATESSPSSSSSSSSSPPAPESRKRKEAPDPGEPPSFRRRVDPAPAGAEEPAGAAPAPAARVLVVQNRSTAPWMIAVEGPDPMTRRVVWRRRRGVYRRVRDLLEIEILGDCYRVPPGSRRFIPLMAGEPWIRVRFFDHNRRNPYNGSLRFDASGAAPELDLDAAPEAQDGCKRTMTLGPDLVTLLEPEWDQALVAGATESKNEAAPLRPGPAGGR